MSGPRMLSVARHWQQLKTRLAPTGFSKSTSQDGHFGPAYRMPNFFRRRDQHYFILEKERERQRPPSVPPPPHVYHDLLDATARVGHVEEQIGYVFKDKLICIEALKTTGWSWPLYYKGVSEMVRRNNRLALLGDRILSMALCEIWYHSGNPTSLYPHTQALETRRSLDAVGRRINLDKYILLHSVFPEPMNDHVAETLEALIAAVYLDAGNSTPAVLAVLRNMNMDQHASLQNADARIMSLRDEKELLLDRERDQIKTRNTDTYREIIHQQAEERRVGKMLDLESSERGNSATAALGHGTPLVVAGKDVLDQSFPLPKKTASGVSRSATPDELKNPSQPPQPQLLRMIPLDVPKEAQREAEKKARRLAEREVSKEIRKLSQEANKEAQKPKEANRGAQRAAQKSAETQQKREAEVEFRNENYREVLRQAFKNAEAEFQRYVQEMNQKWAPGDTLQKKEAEREAYRKLFRDARREAYRIAKIEQQDLVQVTDQKQDLKETQDTNEARIGDRIEAQIEDRIEALQKKKAKKKAKRKAHREAQKEAPTETQRGIQEKREDQGETQERNEAHEEANREAQRAAQKSKEAQEGSQNIGPGPEEEEFLQANTIVYAPPAGPRRLHLPPTLKNEPELSEVQKRRIWVKLVDSARRTNANIEALDLRDQYEDSLWTYYIRTLPKKKKSTAMERWHQIKLENEQREMNAQNMSNVAEEKAQEAERKAKESERKVKEAEDRAKKAEEKVNELNMQAEEVKKKTKDVEKKSKEVEEKTKEIKKKAKEVEKKAKEVEKKAKEVERKSREVEKEAKEAEKKLRTGLGTETKLFTLDNVPSYPLEEAETRQCLQSGKIPEKEAKEAEKKLRTGLGTKTKLFTLDNVPSYPLEEAETRQCLQSGKIPEKDSRIAQTHKMEVFGPHDTAVGAEPVPSTTTNETWDRIVHSIARQYCDANLVNGQQLDMKTLKYDAQRYMVKAMLDQQNSRTDEAPKEGVSPIDA